MKLELEIPSSLLFLLNQNNNNNLTIYRHYFSHDTWCSCGQNPLHKKSDNRHLEPWKLNRTKRYIWWDERTKLKNLKGGQNLMVGSQSVFSCTHGISHTHDWSHSKLVVIIYIYVTMLVFVFNGFDNSLRFSLPRWFRLVIGFLVLDSTSKM